jgi:hypothetical protein
MKIFIPYLAPSTNKMYSGQHWAKRVQHKSDTVMAVIVALAGRKEKFTNPVRVEVLPCVAKGKKFYDVSNYSYSYKLIEDALVGLGILNNDTPEFVKEVCFKSPERGQQSGIQLSISEIK